MAKWCVKKDPEGIFNWKATSPDGKRSIRSSHFESVIQKAHDLARQDALSEVTRLTVVGGAGRLFETWGITNVAMVLQDDGRTLKIFYREEQGNE